MFNYDTWGEIAQSVSTHKLRTALTMLTVAWGIFMLVLLQGLGNGVRNGVEYQFRDDAVNSVFLAPGTTSTARDGLPSNRAVRFENADHDSLRTGVGGVDRLSSRFYLDGDYTVSYGDNRGAFDIRAVSPDHRFLEKTKIVAGRFINQLDALDRRRVVVIGVAVKSLLFGRRPAVGEYLRINSVPFQVVGVFEDEGGERELQKIYLPVATAQMLYGVGDRVHRLMFTTRSYRPADSEQTVDTARGRLGRNHGFSAQDPRALRVWNNLEEYEKVVGLFVWVRVFVWIVGAGTLLTGILALSNVMVISVRERTKEIGIRKAIGAPPGSIVAAIVTEATVITAVAGYIGLAAALAVVAATDKLVVEAEFLRSPSVDAGVVVGVTVLVVVAGSIAGLIPALRAARIDPVVALAD